MKPWWPRSICGDEQYVYGNKVPDRELSPEAEVAESASSKTRPQLLFCVSLIAA